MAEPRAHRRRLILFFGAIGLLYAMSEGVLLLAAPSLQGRIDMKRVRDVLKEQTSAIDGLLTDTAPRLVLDSALGWRHRPGYSVMTDRYNAVGLRSDREYPIAKPASGLRVAAFGDTYVYAAEVSNEEAWTRLIEVERPTTEVLNYGVSGYGTDQAYLRFLQEGMLYAPDVVLIGFSPVELRRSVMVYTRFGSTNEPPLTKPRFVLDSAQTLVLVPNPLPHRGDWERLRAMPRSVIALGRHDAWYDRWRYENALYDRSATMRFAVGLGSRIWQKYFWDDRIVEQGLFRTASSAFALQQELLLAFADSVRARGARPIIVMFPDLEAVERRRDELPPIYAPLKEAITATRRVPVIDLLDAFAAEGGARSPQRWFAPRGHYSVEGNAVVARWLGSRLGDD